MCNGKLLLLKKAGEYTRFVERQGSNRYMQLVNAVDNNVNWYNVFCSGRFNNPTPFGDLNLYWPGIKLTGRAFCIDVLID